MSVDRREFDALAARVAALEARAAAPAQSSGAMRIHGPVLPEPMPPHVQADPIGAVRNEIRRQRQAGATWDAAWDRLDLRWIDKAQNVYAQSNNLRTHGFRDYIEAPLRQEAAA
jgi:hypothetical protein